MASDGYSRDAVLAVLVRESQGAGEVTLIRLITPLAS